MFSRKRIEGSAHSATLFQMIPPGIFALTVNLKLGVGWGGEYWENSRYGKGIGKEALNENRTRAGKVGLDVNSPEYRPITTSRDGYTQLLTTFHCSNPQRN